VNIFISRENSYCYAERVLHLPLSWAASGMMVIYWYRTASGSVILFI
jgi:hypothetical protein